MDGDLCGMAREDLRQPGSDRFLRRVRSYLSSSPFPQLILLPYSYFTALILCPICGTNIGGTILAVEIIRSPTFSSSALVRSDPRILQAAIYSLALASNVGAMSWTISSSLAGLLWARILGEKGIKVTQGEFARWMIPVLLVLSTVSSAVVLLEVYYFL
jgi:di/tricarboxylate transporter